MPGAVTLNLSLAPGGQGYASFPQGSIGGPVTVTSNVAVLATQRVQYFQTVNEVWAMTPALAATTSFINWFDKSSPGMVGDNIHVINPSGATASVTVSLDLPPVGDLAVADQLAVASAQQYGRSVVDVELDLEAAAERIRGPGPTSHAGEQYPSKSQPNADAAGGQSPARTPTGGEVPRRSRARGPRKNANRARGSSRPSKSRNKPDGTESGKAPAA